MNKVRLLLKACFFYNIKYEKQSFLCFNEEIVEQFFEFDLGKAVYISTRKCRTFL